ncbi:hypothetical protein BaRGS_00025290 [Batillaria attramentaria]|uniref:LRAT domain-containing protein n=1 Tax=Batillaria attramentaria TaxID=370345 RepID=A0ABD0K8R2_9CAEN
MHLQCTSVRQRTAIPEKRNQYACCASCYTASLMLVCFVERPGTLTLYRPRLCADVGGAKDVKAGNGEVIHVAGDEGSSAACCSKSAFSASGVGSPKALVRKDSISKIKGVPAVDNMFDRSFNALPKDEIVQRATEAVNSEVDYNVFFYNCEHFAIWCRYNIWTSVQVKNLKNKTIGYFLLVVLFAAFIVIVVAFAFTEEQGISVWKVVAVNVGMCCLVAASVALMMRPANVTPACRCRWLTERLSAWLGESVNTWLGNLGSGVLVLIAFALTITLDSHLCPGRYATMCPK